MKEAALIILTLVLVVIGLIWLTGTIPGHGDEVKNPPTITIEGCEYIQVRPSYDKSFTHKGNCKNPFHEKTCK
jgi:hypothetical protein